MENAIRVWWAGYVPMWGLKELYKEYRQKFQRERKDALGAIGE